ncbi:MAG: autotransporter-associated beta strand repeat-containing protein [Luteolibacter sp.]|uniref:autotransporter-associated beta strand repeat-containing protein n=1 Tax=Luteolibacter sp. TaxID=1962973 RepID=UPI003262CF92
MKLTRNPFVIGSTLAAFFLSYTGSHAAGIWDGGGELTPTTPGNYDTAANWDNNAVPGAINVNVTNGGTILVTTNHTTNDILAGTNTNSTGTWTQSAGVVTMGGGWFRLGTAAGASGTYNLSGDPAVVKLTTVGRISIGENSGTTAGNSAVNISGGTWTNNGAQLTVGGESNGGGGVGRATLSLSGNGVITNNSELWIGQNTGSVGVFNMSAGTVSQVGWVAVGRGNGTGTMNMTGGNFTKTVANTNATIIGASGAGTLNQTAGAISVLNGETWVGETKAGVWTMSGGTAGVLVLNVGQDAAGTGTLTLQNAASGLTGALANGGGTEVLTATAVTIGRLATSTGTINLDGGTLAVNTVAKGAGTGTFNFNGGKLQARTATATFMGGLTNAFVKAGGAVIDTNGNAVTISQALLNNGGGGLTKQGTAALTLSGANTFTGDTVVSADSLILANATALGGSTLNYNNQGGTVSFGALAATTFGGLKGSQPLALTNASLASVALTVGNNNTNSTYDGVLSGSGSLIKNGTGSLTLTNATNSFTGGVTVSAGSLIVPNSTALGTTAKLIDVSNGTAGNVQLHLNGSGGSVNLPGTFTYSTSNTAGTIFNDAGTNSIAGQINMVAGGGGTNIQSDAGSLTVSANITATTGTRSLALQGVSDGTVSGMISDGATSGLPLTKNGAGTWLLSGLNSYTGITTVNAGTLRAGIAQSGITGALGFNSAVVLANTAGAVLDLNGFDTTIGFLGGGGAAGGNVALGAGYLTTGLLNNAATYAGVIGGTGGLIKEGSQALSLTNASTYTGATTINDGTLTLDHSGANLGALGGTAVNVSGSGTLLVKGNTNIGVTAAGTLASSNTVSLQDTTINTLTVGGGASLNSSALNFDLAGGTADKIITNATGSVSGTNTINLNLLLGQSVTTGSYTLITAPGGLGSGGSAFTVGTKPAGFYNYALTSSTPTAVVLSITGAATPGTAYWTGKGSDGTSDSNNNWSSGSSIPKSNWSTTLNGLSDPLQVPGASTDVIFTASNAAGSGFFISQLDANYSIKSLSFNTTPQGSITDVFLDTNFNTLTLGSGGITVAAADNSNTGIGGSGSVVLNGSQTWSNNSNSKLLAVNAGISGFSGITTLTLNGTGTGGVSLDTIGNGTATSVGLVFNQAGVTSLTGNNGFTGGVVISSGTVSLSSAGAFNTTTPNALAFSAGSTGLLRINDQSVTVSSLNTNATVGTPVIENSGVSPVALTDNVAAGTDTFAGVLQDGSGGGSFGLTKAGAGTLSLTGQNTYTGTTSINAGTLTLGSAENPGISGPMGNFGQVAFGGGILQYSALNLVDYSPRFATGGAQQFKIDTNGQNVTYASNLTGPGGNIQKYGAGKLTLTGTNSTTQNVFGHAGSLVLDTAAKITTTGFASIGTQTGDSSIVTVNGTSQLLVTGDFNVSDVTGTNGVLNIADTATVKGTTFYLGKSGTATGTVNQTGGSFSPTAGSGDWRIGGAASAADAAAVGIYNISNGTFTTAANLQIGAFGSGAMNISGTAAVTQTGGFFSVGRFAGGYGMLDVNGGSFTFNVPGNRALIGETGTGVLNVRAGTFTTTSTSTTAALTIGNDNNVTSVGQVNLTGGTINAASVGKVGAAATATFNFNGGILKASAASATYMTGLNNAYVYSGGANIDADGKAITIGQALLSPAATSGVTGISITNGGTGYNTAPIIRITGGGGTGATAVATINPVTNEINSITVTNPGVGYTSTPTVVLVNGLSGGTGATFSPTVAANTSGVLIASSTTAGGVITLTGANTFTGDTTINTGTTLQLGNGTTGNDGTILSATITNNGTLTYNRFGALSFGGTINGTGGVSKLGGGTQTLTATNTYTGVTTVGGGVLSVASLQNGGVNSNIGASTAASANLVFGGNGSLLYTGPTLVTDRGYTVGAGGGGIDHANDVTFSGQILSTATGSFTKNGAGTLNYTYTGGTNALTGGNVGNGLGYIVNNGLVNLGGTAGSPLAQTNTITGELSIGTIATGSSPAAEVRINGGTTNVTSYIGVGRGNGTNNAATALTVNNNAAVTSGNFAIGYANGLAGFTSSPTVTFNGSSTYIDNGVFTVGESANGAGGVSTVNVNGTASITLTGGVANAVSIGFSGLAEFHQNGGSVTSTSLTNGIVTLARNGGTGTYFLDGGTLSAPAVAKGAAGTGIFNFNGGTLSPIAPSATFMQGLTRANVRNGGAIVNTAGSGITIGQALVHSDVIGDAAIDGGLTKQSSGVLTMTGVNSYTGDTTVNGGTLELTSNVSLGNLADVKLATGTVLKLSYPAPDLATPDVVSHFYINGLAQAAGIWSRVGGAAVNQSTLIQGDGLLSVTNGPATTPYDSWATTTKGLSGGNAAAGADPDSDGSNNLAEFIQGGEPNPANPNAGTTPPAPAVSTSGGNHIFSFRRTQLALTQPGLTIAYEYGSNLTGWTVAVHGVNGITITTTTDGYGAGVDKVDVSIPDSLAPVGTRFARLHGSQP